MKFTALILGVLLANVAFSFNAKRLLRMPDLNENLNMSTACTDFSGTWKGTCTDPANNQAEADMMIVKQSGCESIIINNEKMEFDVEKITTEEDDSSLSEIAVTFNWADQKQENFVVNYLISGESKPASPVEFVYSATGKGIVKIVNNQLISTSTTSSKLTYDGQTLENKETLNCKYDKQ